MTKFAQTTLAASAIALMAGAASAATVTEHSRFVNGDVNNFITFQNTEFETLSKNGPSISGDLFNLSFQFNTQTTTDVDGDGDNDALQYLLVDINQAFSLDLLDYNPDLTTRASTGFFIDLYGDDGMVTRFTLDGDDSNCSVPGGTAYGGSCIRISSEDFPAANGIVPEFYLGMFEAGKYGFGIYEGNTAPPEGNIDFRISAVPVPAAGFMLLAGLGGLAAARRRKG